MSDEACGDDERRQDRLDRTATPGPNSVYSHWIRARNPIWMLFMPVVIWILKYVPSVRLKNVVLRTVGAEVGARTALAIGATPDFMWPDRITFGEDVIVGYDATILCHEFLQDEYRVGDVWIGDRATIGTGATVLPGVRIGADATVAANSLVASDVPRGTTVAGVPAEPVDDHLSP
ncbi:acyltransferase [Halococcoides cellulosivorans]|uniref:Acetyltransferase n=1 Tax=Halococcoides cellulosivorans TaxID=1679096 RepID=A0A2R4WYS2_9EURY|nr:DapH/DapD/GlmU-related protein [Halococcoides cellulosivorans]AWB26676.1 acetyltransferase [Halococcoides cellulosivorans]